MVRVKGHKGYNAAAVLRLQNSCFRLEGYRFDILTKKTLRLKNSHTTRARNFE